MAGIIVSHGYRMSAEDHWYAHLADELTARGHRVAVPSFPTPRHPHPDAWLKTLAAHVEALGVPAGETVLVGHSLGGAVSLRLLEQHDPVHGPFAGVVLVASPSTDAGYAELSPFYSPGFAWPRIRRAARGFHVLHAADDPVTGARTPAHVLTWVRGLAATATLTPDGGHFPSPGGTCPRLPEAARLVQRCLEPAPPAG